MKTYKIMIEESTTWDLEITGKNYQEAIEKAIKNVADHEWGYYRMVGDVKYKCVASCIDRKEKKDGS